MATKAQLLDLTSKSNRRGMTLSFDYGGATFEVSRFGVEYQIDVYVEGRQRRSLSFNYTQYVQWVEDIAAKGAIQ
jgi:hypothetical protein